MFDKDDLMFVKGLAEFHLNYISECITINDEVNKKFLNNTDLDVLNYGKSRCLEIINKINNYENENRDLLH